MKKILNRFATVYNKLTKKNGNLYFKNKRVNTEAETKYLKTLLTFQNFQTFWHQNDDRRQELGWGEKHFQNQLLKQQKSPHFETVKKSASNRKETSCCIYTENSIPHKWSLHYIVKNYDEEKKVPKINFDFF